MKKRLLVVVLAAGVACALVVLGGADGRKPLSGEEAYKKFVGTWVNAKEEGNQVWVKMIIQADHAGKCWVHTYSPSAQELVFKVLKAWVDAEGNTYFQYHYRCKSCQGLGLMKLDKARQVLEVNQKMGKEGDALAEQIERQSPSANWTLYMIFYRA